MRRRRRSKLARPYICRFIILRLVIGPSACPLLQGKGRANRGAILMQTGREGLDRAHPTAARLGQPIIQGNSGGARLRRLPEAGTTDELDHLGLRRRPRRFCESS
jgi:hypothetical protein